MYEILFLSFKFAKFGKNINKTSCRAKQAKNDFEKLRFKT